MCRFAYEEGLGVNWVSAVLCSKRLALSTLIHHSFSSTLLLFLLLLLYLPTYFVSVLSIFLLPLFVLLILVSFIENRCKVISNDGKHLKASVRIRGRKKSWDPPPWDQQDAS